MVNTNSYHTSDRFYSSDGGHVISSLKDINPVDISESPAGVVLRAKMKAVNGDSVSNYIRYDNYNNQGYMNFAHWEKSSFGSVSDLLFWVGDFYWVFLMVGSVSFMGLMDSSWLERTGGGVLVGLYRRMFLKILDFAYGRENLPFGGFKKLWELWAMVFFSLVFSEVLPFSTQVTFLGYPLAVLVVSGIFSLWLSSFSHSPFGFLKGVVPSGVPALGVPFISVLMLISSWMRPLVLTMRLTMAAVLMVTLEGIFHYFCVEASDLSLAASYSQADSFSVDSGWAWMGGNTLICWRENAGLFSMGFLGFSGVLGLEKLFYMSFQVTLLASLMMIYQLEHVGAFKGSKVI